LKPSGASACPMLPSCSPSVGVLVLLIQMLKTDWGDGGVSDTTAVVVAVLDAPVVVPELPAAPLTDVVVTELPTFADEGPGLVVPAATEGLKETVVDERLLLVVVVVVVVVVVDRRGVSGWKL
jgi:hypothetical protein